MNFVKKGIMSAVRSMPQSLVRSFLQRAALAPPALKTSRFERVCSAIARNALSNSRDLWLTNLGVSSKLHCRVPVAKSSYIFGRPENFLSERATVAVVRALSGDCAHFIDVGANEGIFTFVASCGKPLQMHWFEPDQTLHDRLRKNLDLNAIATFANKVAVAEQSGTARFLRNLSDDASGSLVEHFGCRHETTSEQVNTIRLTDYFRNHQIHDALVKVDVEGAGSAVWSGARDVIENIKYLVMEMLGPEIQQELPARIISEGRLHAYYIYDFELMESRDGKFQYMEPFWNWLFCRLNPSSLSSRLAGTRFRVLPQGG